METSILGCKAYCTPKQPLNSDYLTAALLSTSDHGLKLLRLAKSLDTLRDSLNMILENCLTQAKTWANVLKYPVFCYGANSFMENWEQKTETMPDLCNGLSRVLSLLVAASEEIKLRERSRIDSNNDVNLLVMDLVECAMGYVIMTCWWWFQIAIGSEQLQRLLYFKKLNSPLKERIQASMAKNQDIVEEYIREYTFLKSLVSPMVLSM